MKGVQFYELFQGIALKNHAFLGGPKAFTSTTMSKKGGGQTSLREGRNATA